MDSRPSYGPVSGLSLGRVLRKPWSHLAGQVVGEPGRSRSAFGIRDGASRTSSRPTGCVGTEPCSPIPAWRALNEAEEPPRPRSGTVRCRRTTVPAVTARRCRCATRSWARCRCCRGRESRLVEGRDLAAVLPLVRQPVPARDRDELPVPLLSLIHI